MSIDLPKLTEDLNNIQSLEDQPTLTSDELKQEFDKAGNTIKDYLNNILVPKIQQEMNNSLGEALENKLKRIKEELEKDNLDKLKNRYHIGKIIHSSENINPATYLGFGTWELMGKGRVLVGYDNGDTDYNQVGKKGGNKKINLSSVNIPVNGLSVRCYEANIDNTPLNRPGRGGWVLGNDQGEYGSWKTGKIASNTNGNQSVTPVDIRQPYEVVFIFKRIA